MARGGEAGLLGAIPDLIRRVTRSESWRACARGDSVRPVCEPEAVAVFMFRSIPDCRRTRPACCRATRTTPTDTYRLRALGRWYKGEWAGGMCGGGVVDE